MIDEISIFFETRTEQHLFKRIDILHEKTIHVSSLLSKLEDYKSYYIHKIKFQILMKILIETFNTFLTYFDFDNFFLNHLKKIMMREEFTKNIKS